MDARLNQIETATEEDSNVNEDFVHWLKTSFPIYVLMFAAAAGGYIWYFQDQATQQANTIDAWREFRAASNPDSLLELASEKEVTLPHLSVQARLQAGNLQLQAVRRNRPVNAEADSTEPSAMKHGKRHSLVPKPPSKPQKPPRAFFPIP